MIYLDERQVGYDGLAIGFPSIDGCHALALQTDTGLFGFHIVGGERKEDFSSRTQAFATYVTGHHAPGKFLHLYGTCFRTTKRGYTGNQLDGWKKEMKAYAKALKFKGPVSGYNLSTQHGWPEGASAYVEYRRVFSEVQVICKPWTEVTKTTTEAANLSAMVNRRTTGTDGSVNSITFGKNHTASVSFPNGLTLVSVGLLDSFKV